MGEGGGYKMGGGGASEVKGEGGVYKGQKSHNPVGGPSFQQFKAFMEISGIS